MVTTRDERVNILRHLLFNVLDIDRNDTDHAVIKCFDENNLKTIADFEVLDEADIDQLTYTRLNTTTNTDECRLIPVGHRANLRHLRKYAKLIIAQYHESNNSYPPITHWRTLNWDMFQVYKSLPNHFLLSLEKQILLQRLLPRLTSRDQLNVTLAYIPN